MNKFPASISFRQESFFRILKSKLKPEEDLSDFLSEHFNWSRATQYKKLSGESKLQLEDILLLAALVPDLAMEASDLFKAQNLNVVQIHTVENLEHLERYLFTIEDMFKTALSDPNHCLQYVARDLPLLYFFSNADLFRYKWAFWSHTPCIDGMPFLPPIILNTAERIYTLYEKLNGFELWNHYAFEAQRQQLNRDLEIEFIRPSQHAQLMQYYQYLEAKIVEAAANKRKAGGGSYEAKLDWRFSLNNGLYLKYHNEESLNTSVHSLHYVKSVNRRLLKHFKNDCKNHWEESVRLKFHSS